MTEPPMPSKGMNVTDWCVHVWRYIRSIRLIPGAGLSVQQTSSGTLISLNTTGKGTDTLPPFSVTVGKKNDAWQASISRGVVAERVITKDADTVTYWKPSGMLDEDGKSTPITIKNGDGLFVVVSVTADGEIEKVTVETAPADDVSVSHYAPAVGNDSGSSGTYQYRLGKLEVEGTSGKFIPDMAGSNIDHFPVLPKFKKEAGDYDIFKKYELGEKAYKTKGLTEEVVDSGIGEGLKTITVTDTGDELKFSTKGGTHEVTLRNCDKYSGYTSEVRLRMVFVNGLFIKADKSEPEGSDVTEIDVQGCFGPWPG